MANLLMEFLVNLFTVSLLFIRKKSILSTELSCRIFEICAFNSLLGKLSKVLWMTTLGENYQQDYLQMRWQFGILILEFLMSKGACLSSHLSKGGSSYKDRNMVVKLITLKWMCQKLNYTPSR